MSIVKPWVLAQSPDTVFTVCCQVTAVLTHIPMGRLLSGLQRLFFFYSYIHFFMYHQVGNCLKAKKGRQPLDNKKNCDVVWFAQTNVDKKNIHAIEYIERKPFLKCVVKLEQNYLLRYLLYCCELSGYAMFVGLILEAFLSLLVFEKSCKSEITMNTLSQVI